MIHFVFFFFSFFLQTCTSVSRFSSTTAYEGKSGDLIVVCDFSSNKKAEIEALEEVLDSNFLPSLQAEKYLNLYFSDRAVFEQFQKKRRNILLLSLDSNAKNFVLQQDQTTIDPQKPFLKNNKALIYHFFDQIENQRALQIQMQNPSSLLLKEKFQIDLKVPASFEVSLEEENFVWLSNHHSRKTVLKDAATKKRQAQYHDVIEGIFIYTEPFQAQKQWDLQERIARRDHFLKKIPLEKEGAFMKTLYQDAYFYGPQFDPKSEEIILKNQYALQIRGIFQSENTNMGGLFISMSVLHPHTKQLLTLDSYVYAPQFGKREYLRQFKALFETIEFL